MAWSGIAWHGMAGMVGMVGGIASKVGSDERRKKCLLVLAFLGSRKRNGNGNGSPNRNRNQNTKTADDDDQRRCMFLPESSY